jgi:hypothetical protein
MENLQTEKEKLLWKMARKRVSFKRQLVMYLIVNVFLWIMWYLTDGRSYDHGGGIYIAWPLWCTLGWGIGMAWSYYGAYVSNTPDAVEREFEKLKGKN